ncbi:MAG: hypothetical protein LBS56_01875, partial [Propionibacteriaceae bacterium]|nr:hypothetical protein [Propionibacteriaceae bacterium]
KADKGLRGDRLDDGVEFTPDGGAVVSFHVEPKGMTSDFSLDLNSGKLTFMARNKIDYTRDFLEIAAYEPDPEPVTVRLPARSFGRCEVTVDTAGGLTVTRPGHVGPLFVDCFPDHQGHTVCFRRPPVRSVVTKATKSGWITTDSSGAARRVVVEEDGLSIECRLPASATGAGLLAVRPWIGLRTCEYKVTSPGGADRGDYLHWGLWPPYLPGYEACADADWSTPLAGAVQTWTDRTAGLAVSLKWFDAGRLRHEGQARADGPVLRYRLRVHDNYPPVADSPAPLPDVVSDPARWEASTWGTDLRYLTTADGGAEVVVAPTQGLVSWRVGDETVLPDATSQKGFHCLTRVPATIWPSLNTPRDDLHRGPEWAEDDPRIRFADPTADGSPDPAKASWAVTGDAGLGVLELSTHAPGQYAGLEAVLNVKVPTTIEAVQVADSAGDWITLARHTDTERPLGLWWAYTRKLSVPLPSGRRLLVEPLAGEAAEILVRGVVDGFVFNLMSRVTPDRPDARWRLTLL